MTWANDKNRRVLEAAQEILDALEVDCRGAAQRNALLAVLTRLYATASKAGESPEQRNNTIYRRAYYRNGGAPSKRQIEAMRREVCRPFNGAAAIDGAPGE